MAKQIITIAVLITLLTGCTSTGNQTIASTVTNSGIKVEVTTLSCKKYIQYNANKIKLDGLEIPITSSKGQIIKLGSLDLGQENLRDASERMQALDTLQYENCQLLSIASSNNAVTPELINRFHESNMAFHNYIQSLIKN